MVSKIDIISGFLGAGKTTLIKKLLKESFTGEKVVLIENEFGEIGIDGTILKDFDIEIKEMNSGCICCSIQGDFTLALKEVIKLYQPERIIIEPSGVGKLSDVIKGCSSFIKENTIRSNMCITVVDGTKYNMYLKNFAEFYKNQLSYAKTIFLSRTQKMKSHDIDKILRDIRKYNSHAPIVTTNWSELDGKKIVAIAENSNDVNLEKDLKRKLLDVNFNGANINTNRPIRKMNLDTKSLKDMKMSKEPSHHADEVFNVWGIETAKCYDLKELNLILNNLNKLKGTILRAKGFLEIINHGWIQFDYVPNEIEIRDSNPDYTGRICVIGENIQEEELAKLFGV